MDEISMNSDVLGSDSDEKSADEWEGWPPPGTRVRVPHKNSTIEGEVISHRRTWHAREQVARVRIYMPIGTEPYKMAPVYVPFGREALEVIEE
jgi:hypothetical protein